MHQGEERWEGAIGLSKGAQEAAKICREQVGMPE